MPAFIVVFALLDATPAEETALHLGLATAGFLDTVVSSNRVTYQLPPFTYRCEGVLSKDEVFECAKRIAFRTRRRSRILVVECVSSSWVGLEMVGRHPAGPKRTEADLIAPHPLLATISETPSPTENLTTPIHS